MNVSTALNNGFLYSSVFSDLLNFSLDTAGQVSSKQDRIFQIPYRWNAILLIAVGETFSRSEQVKCFFVPCDVIKLKPPPLELNPRTFVPPRTDNL
jgi:hypothetical protein